MKILNTTGQFLVALALIGASFTGIAAEQKKTDSALMEPVKSFFDHYLSSYSKGIGEGLFKKA